MDRCYVGAGALGKAGGLGGGDGAGDGEGVGDGDGLRLGKGVGVGGPATTGGNGFCGTLVGVGVAIESTRKRTSATSTSAVGTASISAPLVGRTPVL